MLLFALAIAPGIAISLYFFFRDEYNREPRRHLVVSFFLGFVSALIAVVIETGLLTAFEHSHDNGILYIAFKAFIVVALTEEWAKYVMVKSYAYPKPEFDEPFDGIVYCVMVSMGFATLENIAYVMQHGFATALMRMFLSVPAHATFAVLMGYHMGKAKFSGGNERRDLMTGLLLATLFHGFFDFFLFLQENRMVAENVSGLLLFAGAIASYGIAFRLSRKAVVEHMAVSRSMHGDGEQNA